MTFEQINTAAQIGTFSVIAITAIAALWQIRVLRQTTQVTALSALLDRWEDPAMRTAYRFLTVTVPQRMAEPEFRSGFGETPVRADVRDALVVMNFFETLGIYVRLRVIPKNAALSFYSSIIANSWDRAKPAIAIMRRNGPAYENFEYLAFLAQSLATFDDYPPNTPRMSIDDAWLEADSPEKGAALKPADDSQRG
jgi:hypothetical protein